MYLCNFGISEFLSIEIHPPCMRVLVSLHPWQRGFIKTLISGGLLSDKSAFIFDSILSL